MTMVLAPVVCKSADWDGSNTSLPTWLVLYAALGSTEPFTVMPVIAERQAESSGVFVTVTVALTFAPFCGVRMGVGVRNGVLVTCCGTNVRPFSEVPAAAV